MKAQALSAIALLSSIGAVIALCVPACSAAGGSGSAGSGAGGSGANGPDGSYYNVDDSGHKNFGDANCGAATYSASRVPASVLLLLDRSGSMSDCADGSDSCSQDKWDGAKAAISGALTTAPPELGMGLDVFPAEHFDYNTNTNCMMTAMEGGALSQSCQDNLADGGCTDVFDAPLVAVDVLQNTQSQINSALSGIDPAGNTPTLYALKSAYSIMTAMQVQGDRYVLLMTDGDPTTDTPPQKIGAGTIPETNIACLQLQDILNEAQAAAQANPPVLTFVVGSPGVDNFQFMSQLAQAGGTAKAAGCDAGNSCYYQIGQGNFAGDLQAVLTQIAGQVATCVFAVPPGTAQSQPDMVNVTYNVGNGDQDLYQDATDQDGWNYTDSTHNKIEIYGPACDAIKQDTSSTVTILIGCKTVVR